MTRLVQLFSLLMIGAYLTGCAGLNNDYETPTVNIRSFKAIQGEEFEYRLDAKLEVGTLHPVIRVSKKGNLSEFHSPRKQQRHPE